jgi:hypothetical protein
MAPAILVFLAAMSLHPAARRDSSVQKTWTNDDIDLLRANAPISVFSVPATPQTSAATPASAAPVIVNPPYVKELDSDWYAKQIGAIQTQITASSAVIRKIEDIRKSGVGISNVIPLDREDVGLSPEATVQILQSQNHARKADVDNLEELARRNSIPPGEIQ